MSWKGRTSDSRRDRTSSEIHRRVDWGIVGLLAETGLDRESTNRCPKEADTCLFLVREATYGIPSAIRHRTEFATSVIASSGRLASVPLTLFIIARCGQRSGHEGSLRHRHD